LAQSPIPNPQSPIPNPQYLIKLYLFKKSLILKLDYLFKKNIISNIFNEEIFIFSFFIFI